MPVILDWIRQNYFWITILVAGLVIYLIYRRFDNSTKLKIRKIFSGKSLAIIIFAVIWFIWHNTGGSSTVKTSSIWMPIIGLLVLAGYNYIGGLKYETQQIQCANGYHGSYSKPPIEKDGFLIYAIHSFNAGGLSWDYAGDILVLRKETVEFCDRGSVSIARPTPCNTGTYDLPPSVKEVIENNKYLKGRSKQVFYGWFDDIEKLDFEYEQLSKLDETKQQEHEIFPLLKKEFNVKNPKVSTLFWLYKNECKASNKQTEQFDATVEAVEKGVEHHKRIKDAYIERSEKPHSMEGHEEF